MASVANFIQSVSKMHLYHGRMLNLCKKCFSQDQDKRPSGSLAENSPSPFAKEICCFRQTDEFLHLSYSEKRKGIHLSCKMVYLVEMIVTANKCSICCFYVHPIFSHRYHSIHFVTHDTITFNRKFFSTSICQRLNYSTGGVSYNLH